MPQLQGLRRHRQGPQHEGYIAGYDVIDDGRQGILRLQLKYGPHGEHLINVSSAASPSPADGCTRKVVDLPRPWRPGHRDPHHARGVLSDRQCREERVGGELLCTVE